MLMSSSDSENEHDEESRRISASTSSVSNRLSNEITSNNNRIFQTQYRYSFSDASGEPTDMNRSIAAVDSTESRSNRFGTGDCTQSKRRRLADETLSRNNNSDFVTQGRSMSSNNNISRSTPHNTEDLLSGTTERITNLSSQQSNLSPSDRDQLIVRLLQQVEGGSAATNFLLSPSTPNSTIALSDLLIIQQLQSRSPSLGLQNSSPLIVDQPHLLSPFQPANNLASLLAAQLQQQQPTALLEQQRTLVIRLNHSQISGSGSTNVMENLQPLQDQYRRLLLPATPREDRPVEMPLGFSAESLPNQQALSFLSRHSEPIPTSILQLLQSPTSSNQAIAQLLQMDSLAPGLDQGLRNYPSFHLPVDSFLNMMNRPSIAESLVPDSVSHLANQPNRNISTVIDQLRSSLNRDMYSSIVGAIQPGGNPQRVSSHTSIIATEVPSNADGGLYLPITIARPEDSLKLSENQCLLRHQIEAFQAAESDVSTHTRGRNKPITLKQVGIRCIHCAHLKISQRHKGSTYFPASVHGLYQAAQNMSTTHIQSGMCSEMPESLKTKFAQLSSMKVASSGAGRPYWASTAKDLGLIDTDQGIFFIRDLPPHVNIIDRGGSA